MFIKIKSIFFVATALSLCFLSCSKDKNIPDVSTIPVDLSIKRFEQDLFKLDTNNIALSLEQLEQKYPNFSDLFFNQVLPMKRALAGENPTETFHKNVKGFIAFESIQALNDTCQIVFQDFKALAPEFEQAFQFYKYYFPEKNIPEIYTFISEYTYQTFIFDNKGKDALGIGLDMFLGSDYPYMQYIPNNPAFSAYITRSFDKKHIVKKSMDALIDDILGVHKGNRLLDEMMHNGKKLLILEHLLPYAADSVLLEYTAVQSQWCKDNELEIWSYLIGEDLLYSTDRKRIRKLVGVSPTGPSDMPPAAPGRVANWVGWQILKHYLARHPETSLQDLLKETDAQKIMDKARYRPR